MADRTQARYLQSDADLSEDGVYRYSLTRRLSMGERIVCFVGTNPSTADGTQDDPTIRKEVGFAQLWGFDWLYMANLHAYRSTDPKKLRTLQRFEASGPRNSEAVKWMTQKAEIVVAAWGDAPIVDEARPLARAILMLPHCRVLGTTKSGNPRHPLYIRYSTTLSPVTEQADARS